MAIRSIELLVREYPDLTGREITALYNKDVEAEEKRIDKANKEAQDWVNWVNEEPRFWKGKFGLGQYWISKVTEARFIEGVIYVDVETITTFYDRLREGIKGACDFERRVKTLQREDKYCFSNDDFPGQSQTTAEEWNFVVAYINGIKELIWKQL